MKSQKDKIREKKGKIEKDMQKRENFDNFEMNTDLDPKKVLQSKPIESGYFKAN